MPDWPPCDLVIVEGYKREGHDKLETRRREAHDTTSLADGDPSVVAIAADHAIENPGLPVFDLDDTEAIADFIETHCGLLRGS